MSQFQLFPPPSPVRGSKNPFRKSVKRPTVKVEPGSPIPLDEVKDSTKTEAVLLQIIEDTQAVPPPPPAHVARTKSPATTDVSHFSISPQSPRSRSGQANKSNSQAWSSPSSLSNSSSSGHTTNSTAPPQSSQTSSSPVPMRSMFPKFDPKLPLNQQRGPPQMASEAPAARPRRPQLTLSPTSEIDQVLGPKTVPASVLNFPTGVLEPEDIHYSSVQDLEVLWDAANGQRPQNLFGTFNMQMTR